MDKINWKQKLTSRKFWAAVTGTGFYYSKAKVENRIKLMRANKIEPSENSFNEY